MWLPTPFYERVTQFWLLLGLLFMSCGTFLGFDNKLSFVYFGVGLACIVWSVAVFVKRALHRSKPVRRPIVIVDEDSQDQTTEHAG